MTDAYYPCHHCGDDVHVSCVCDCRRKSLSTKPTEPFELVKRLGLEVLDHSDWQTKAYYVRASELEALLQKHLTKYTPGENCRMDDSITIWLKPIDQRVSKEEIKNTMLKGDGGYQLLERIFKFGVKDD